MGFWLGFVLTAPIQHTTWKETVQAIHDQGGITVLAHPAPLNGPAWLIERSGPFWTT